MHTLISLIILSFVIHIQLIYYNVVGEGDEETAGHDSEGTGTHLAQLHLSAEDKMQKSFICYTPGFCASVRVHM